MNPIRHSVCLLIAPALALLTSISRLRADEVSATKDGITLPAKCNISPNGLTVVICNIVNRSEHTLAFFDSLQYEYRLLDAAGNVVPQSVVWAKSFHQNGQRSGKGIHLIPGFLQPSEQIVSSFYLESAYEDRVNQGRVLEIAWENRWYGPEHEFSVPETTFPDGRIGPQHTEKNHFPGAWKLAVALPLPDPKIGGAAPARSQSWDPAPPGWVCDTEILELLYHSIIPYLTMRKGDIVLMTGAMILDPIPVSVLSEVFAEFLFASLPRRLCRIAHCLECCGKGCFGTCIRTSEASRPEEVPSPQGFHP